MTLVLAGCATTDIAEPEITSKVERLGPRNLSAGECGLFVWTSGLERQFILFSQAAKFSGAWLTEQGEVALKIIEQDGEPANRQFPSVSYVSDEGGKIELSLKTRETITNGTRFKGGTLRITDDAGWETVKPVVGLTACQPT